MLRARGYENAKDTEMKRLRGGRGRGGGRVDFRVEYQRKRRKDPVTSLISSPATVSLFLRRNTSAAGKTLKCAHRRDGEARGNRDK